MRKYKFTKETKIVAGLKLRRIQALISFSFVEKGELGGWVEKGGNLSQDGDAWVYGNAQVCGNAQVYGDKVKSLVKTLQLFDAYCISITPKYVFCGCCKWKHTEIQKLTYKKADVASYLTKKQFEILKKIVLLAIKF